MTDSRRHLRALAERVSRIGILEAVELVESEPDNTRRTGCELLRARFTKR